MKKIIKTAIASLLTGVIAVSSVSSAAAAQNNADPAGRPGFIDNVSPGYYSAEENRNILPSLVIVVGFDDESDPLPYKDNYDWNKVFFSGKLAQSDQGEQSTQPGQDGQDDQNNQSDLEKLYEPPTQYKEWNSVTKYYETQSYGKFTFVPVIENSIGGNSGNTNSKDRENDGVVHVTLHEAPPDGDNAFACISKAILAADDHVDFAAYDKITKNGHIENNEMIVNIVLAGYESKVSKNNFVEKKNHKRSAHYFALPSPTKQNPHQYDYRAKTADIVTVNGNNQPVIVDEYLRVSENIRRTEDGFDMQTGAQCIVHETAHYLGVPDYYAVDYRSNEEEWSEFRVNAYSPMSSPYGVVLNDKDGKPNEWYTLPYSLDPWAKIKLGWIDNIDVVDDTTPVDKLSDYKLPAINGSSPKVLRINTSNPDEYFLVENRQYTGYDTGMKADTKNFANNRGGIVVWHIDESVIRNTIVNNHFNEYNVRPAVMPVYVERDSFRHLINNTSFIGDECLTNLGVHDKKSLTDLHLNKGDSELPKIDLPLYNATPQKVYNGKTFRRERVYSGISITPLSDSGEVMDLNIKFGDYDLPNRCCKVYFDNSSFGYKKPSYIAKSISGGGDEFLEIIYNGKPGIEMYQVKDNIYCTILPEHFNTITFTDATNPDVNKTELTVPCSDMVYDGTGWKNYKRTSITVLRGDVNGDGVIDINDVTRLQRHLDGHDRVPLIRKRAMDANRDERVTIADVTQIQKCLANMLHTWDKMKNEISSTA